VPELSGERDRVTVGEVTGTGLSLTPTNGIAGQILRFIAPAGAKQGPDTWFMLRMTATATFAPAAGDGGSVLLSALTNGKAAAQIEFYPERDGTGSRTVAWESADLIHGSTDGRQHGRSARVEFENYLQLRGIHGGENQLVLQAERFGGAAVESVVIEPSSGVYMTPVGPVSLSVDAEFTDDSVSVGEPTELQVQVVNHSPRDAKNVEVTVAPQSPHLFTESGVSRKVSRLDRVATSRFVVGSSKPGTMRIGIRAEDALGNAANGFASTRVDASERASDLALRLGASAALTALLIVAYVTTRRGGVET
jgi:hypothetical protein